MFPFVNRKLYEIVENVFQTNTKVFELVYYALVYYPTRTLNKGAQVRWCFMTGCNKRPSVITDRCENKSSRKKIHNKGDTFYAL